MKHGLNIQNKIKENIVRQTFGDQQKMVRNNGIFIQLLTTQNTHAQNTVELIVRNVPLSNESFYWGELKITHKDSIFRSVLFISEVSYIQIRIVRWRERVLCTRPRPIDRCRLGRFVLQR